MAAGAATGATHVAPGVVRIDSIMGSRRLAQWLVAGDDGALLFDTGIAGTVADRIVPALAEVGVAREAVREVIVSHADVDHYGGDAEARRLLPSARLRAHELDRPLIESWAAIAAERYGWYRGYGLDYDEATWRWLANAAGGEAALDGTIDDGDEIDLGGIAVRVLHLPGHSLGHLALFEPGSRTAIIADAAMADGFVGVGGERVSPPPYVDLARYRETIERLRSLAPARIGTAHFPPIEGDDVEAFLDRCVEFTREVDRALDAELGASPQTLPALLAACAERLGGYPEMEVELSRSLGAHLEAMVEAGTVERVELDGLPAWRRR
jgi:glyoxylase-like metal-dependent hydrolase (beta-lactamase superfamily II)